MAALVDFFRRLDGADKAKVAHDCLAFGQAVIFANEADGRVHHVPLDEFKNYYVRTDGKTIQRIQYKR